MSERALRDHSEPCEHGFEEGHPIFIDDHYEGWCPGGREVTIDKMAERVFDALFNLANEGRLHYGSNGRKENARFIVDAALDEV